jgi:outer membrane biogenesis lipoprotein LolB
VGLTDHSLGASPACGVKQADGRSNKTKGRMKKILIALSAAALLAGCASQDNNGMGGTSDQDTTINSSQDTMKTDSIHSTQNGGSLRNNSDTSGTTTTPAQ